MIFLELDEFKKDLKSLLKKYRSLTEDLAVIKQILQVFPNERPPFSFEINDLKLNACIIKVKKIACKSLKGRGVNSGLRLVYAYFPEEFKIVFVELYHKNSQENEDRERIKANFSLFEKKIHGLSI
jgi:mRNA-degrading endonuclease RelE of RelBE toxin-antitoxin system